MGSVSEQLKEQLGRLARVAGDPEGRVVSTGRLVDFLRQLDADSAALSGEVLGAFVYTTPEESSGQIRVGDFVDWLFADDDRRPLAIPSERPPHMPILAQVDVTEMAQSRWEESGGTELDPVLGKGAVVLLDAEWVMERARSGGTLEPRQTLPSAAFMPHSGVIAITPNNDVPLVRVTCVSHCWLQANHPDPRGHNLRILGRALRLLSTDNWTAFRGRWAVFLDLCCMHQNCRDRNGVPQNRTFQRLEGCDCFEDDAVGKYLSEQDCFREALHGLGRFYSHPATPVFMLTQFPDDYDDTSAYTRSGNSAQYLNRGWCFCESSWAALTKPFSYVLDLGLSSGDEFCYFETFGTEGSLVLTCAARRKAPVLPDAFDAELDGKVFSNGKDDRPRVADLYREAFRQRFESAEVLLYSDLGWGDEEAGRVAAALASAGAPRLQKLNLGRNRVGDEGAARLAEALGALPGLQDLRLQENRVGDEGAARLAEALRASGALPRLRLLALQSNRVGDDGAARLAGALRAPGALPQLQRLRLDSNPLGEGARAALRAAWAEAGRPTGGTVVTPIGQRFDRGLLLG